MHPLHNSSRFNNQEILVKDVYKQLKERYTYKVIKKFLRRSNEMIVIVIVKLMSLVATTSVKMKITHSTRSEWIA